MLVKLFLVVLLLGNSGSVNGGRLGTSTPNIVSRSEWNAREPKASILMNTPVGNVVIHHSESPENCNTESACVSTVKGIQRFHMDTQEWDDIGYSFLVGGDGRVYEGRGWSKVGAHAPRLNSNSIGVCIIGNWSTKLPPEIQLQTVKDLIAYGVSSGKISSDYRLVGHRQVRDTTCPGDRLYNEITAWPNWS